jgi:MYXO-CTERM domain-containing protein
MVAFDTSGSMNIDVKDSSENLVANSCNYPKDRNGHARCALKNMVSAFAGQVNFGLAAFALEPSGTNTLGCGEDLGNVTGCTLSTLYGEPLGELGCGFRDPTGNNDKGSNVLVPLVRDGSGLASNAAQILQWVDNNCGDCKELWAKGGTPLNGILRDMRRYLQNFWSHPTNTSLTYLTPLTGSELPCRSVNVILLTDGDEYCDPTVGDDPNAVEATKAAAELLTGFTVTTSGQTITWKIKTHVIAFGQSVLGANNIAVAGGTGAAYSAANEQELASALASIVSGAIKPEICNNGDDNCNGCTDEGYKVYCNRNKIPTTLLELENGTYDNSHCCSSARQACLQAYSNSISASNPTGDRWFLPCWDPASGGVIEENWLCADPLEVCDELDNNCETSLTSLTSNAKDEGFNKCPNCPVPETCNGKDNDCDGIIDNELGNPEPFSISLECKPCYPTPEVCDGCDNDCDGWADNGLSALACGLSTPENCKGTRTCVPTQVAEAGACTGNGGVYTACSATSQPEICDGIDNDCNGIIDNEPSGVGVDCTPKVGDPIIGECKPGKTVCLNGALTCQGYIGPTQEVCDGKDNDCDGLIDAEDPSLTGTGALCGDAIGVCQKGTIQCVGGQLICVQPDKQPEVCDGLDNNCDGYIDNELTDVPSVAGCWSEPAAGCAELCTHAGYSWCYPDGATCSTLGELKGVCATGTLVCGGIQGWKCQGAVGPTNELCDKLDNDCDGKTDEAEDLPAKYGQLCGSFTNPPCKQGNLICVDGRDVCDGEIGPEPEICDGIDNDCDGDPDDGIEVNQSCYPTIVNPALYPGDRTKGICQPGQTVCATEGEEAGTLVCVGGTAPSPEVCDGIDNDCDGQKDERGAPPDGIDGTADPLDPTKIIGQPCGSNVGQCRRGTWGCVEGRVVCQGAIGPQAEICDCLDNDCDGDIDEDAAENELALCSPGKTCVELSASTGGGCQCASPCSSGEFPCAGNFTCDTKAVRSGTESPTGRYCVRAATCDACETKTVYNGDGTIECAPDGTQLYSSRPIPECVCKGLDGCRSPCFGVQCAAGELCIATGPLTGSCGDAEDCYLFGCTQGNICVSGSCADNPCDPNPCAASEMCRANADYTSYECVASCANVTCEAAGDVCKDGDCVATGCGQTCPDGQFCLAPDDPDAGAAECGASKCPHNTDYASYCGDGSHCDPTTGQCGTDPCAGVVCPDGQRCVRGQCALVQTTAPDAGTDSGTDGSVTPPDAQADAAKPDSGALPDGGTKPEVRGIFGLATGGGGCSCRTTGRDGSGALGGLLLLLAAGVLERRRRQRMPTDRVAKNGGAR